MGEAEAPAHQVGGAEVERDLDDRHVPLDVRLRCGRCQPVARGQPPQRAVLQRPVPGRRAPAEGAGGGVDHRLCRVVVVGRVRGDQDRPAGGDRTGALPQRRDRIGEVVQAEGCHQPADPCVPHRQGAGVGSHTGRTMVPVDRQHPDRHVSTNRSRARRHQRPRRRACPRTDVEHDPTGERHGAGGHEHDRQAVVDEGGAGVPRRPGGGVGGGDGHSSAAPSCARSHRQASSDGSPRTFSQPKSTSSSRRQSESCRSHQASVAMPWRSSAAR